MRKALGILARPLVAGFIASVTTLLLLAPPQRVETIREVRVLQPGTRVIHEVRVLQPTCDTSVVEKLLNDVLDSRAATGDATVGNVNEWGEPELSQDGNASSGSAVAGQIIDTIAACSTVTTNATNTVTDTEVRSGDAEVEQRIEEAESSDTPEPSSSPRPQRTLSPEPTPDAPVDGEDIE